MTIITEFDRIASRPTTEIAREFVRLATVEDDAESANIYYQALYARWHRTLTGGFWRPVGHPHATEDGDRLSDPGARHFADESVRDALATR